MVTLTSILPACRDAIPTYAFTVLFLFLLGRFFKVGFLGQRLRLRSMLVHSGELLFSKHLQLP